MNQDKEESVVGIPLDDLSPDAPTEVNSEKLEGDMPDEEGSEEEAVGLPALFDEEELAEVGLKASPFSDDSDTVGTNENLPPDPDTEDDDPAYPHEEVTPPDDVFPEVEEALSGEPSAQDDPTEDEMHTSPDDGEDTGDPAAILSDGDDAPPVYPQSEESLDEVLGEDALNLESEPIEDDPAIDSVQRQFDMIQAHLLELRKDFSGKLKYDAHKDEIIDKLHQELQEYKQDIVKKHILSIVLDVVKVADDIRKWITYFRSLDVSQRDPVKLFRYLEAIPSDLEDIFYWQGVKPYSNKDGDFDPARQRAIKKITTDDISKDKTVAKTLRPGYEWEGKVIRQEMVAVYVYKDEKESVDTGNIDE